LRKLAGIPRRLTLKANALSLREATAERGKTDPEKENVMNADRFSKTPDIYYAQNNGVRAFWPTRNGKLGILVSKTRSGVERCWVFADATWFADEDGDEIVDHHTRGAVCGSFDDSGHFIQKCRELGLVVGNAGYSGNGVGYVPLSNGQRAHGTMNEPSPTGSYQPRPASDWSRMELKRVLVDLPTEEWLRAFLK
jgi:hypothetical protein